MLARGTKIFVAVTAKGLNYIAKWFIDGFIEFVPSLQTSDRKGYDGTNPCGREV